jgi:hypothetical protein
VIIIRVLIIVSALILIGAMLARWWFWGRLKARGQRTECSLTVAELYERLGVEKRKASDLRDAAALGSALRDGGLRLMEMEGATVAKRRRTGWWNLRILPGLLALLLVFSFFSGKKQAASWVLGGGAALIALHVVMRIAAIAVELEAVKRGWKKLEEKGGLKKMDEAEAVLCCARASVWDTVLPW